MSQILEWSNYTKVTKGLIIEEVDMKRNRFVIVVIALLLVTGIFFFSGRKQSVTSKTSSYEVDEVLASGPRLYFVHVEGKKEEARSMLDIANKMTPQKIEELANDGVTFFSADRKASMRIRQATEYVYL